jgi:hypothetical protein
VIPRIGERGLGIGWPARKLDAAEASELLARMHQALARER